MAETHRTRAPRGRSLGRGCAAFVCVAAFLLGVSLVGCGYGGAPTGDTSPTSSISTTLAPFDPPQGPSTTKAAPATPPSTEFGFPVLTELPPISVDDVALVEMKPLRGRSFPLRILSPGADRELVEQLLVAYEKAALAPAEGFPAPERLQRAQLAQNLVIRRRDGSEVWILVPKEGDRVVVDDSDKELLVIGEDGGGSTPRAWGTAPDLADLSRTLAAEPDPADFGAGRPGLPHEMPDDFGFILYYGPLMPSRNILDTFSGTLHKDMVGDPNTTTDMRLSPQQLEEIYGRMVDIGIEGYPRVFKPEPDPPESSGTIQYDDPFSSSYFLRLRADGRELVIEWEDHSQPSHVPEADALRSLLNGIERMVESSEEYKGLPPAAAYG